jgi:hypothetical protein
VEIRHFLFHLAQVPGHRRRAHPALQRHATRRSVEAYSRLALADAQQRYDDVIGDFSI